MIGRSFSESATQTMGSGTKIRRFTRLLDGASAPFWALGPSGRLIYLSAGCGQWLGVEIESLVDRRSIAGAPVSDDPLDRLAASLSHGTAHQQATTVTECRRLIPATRRLGLPPR